MVRISKSTIPKAGKGVFATRDYKKNEYLGTYKGILIDPKTFNSLKNADYVWELLDEDNDAIAYIDARDERFSNWTRYVNCPCEKSQENVKVVQNLFDIEYYAKKNIKKGDELFVWYGSEYGKQLIGRKRL